VLRGVRLQRTADTTTASFEQQLTLRELRLSGLSLRGWWRGQSALAADSLVFVGGRLLDRSSSSVTEAGTSRPLWEYLPSKLHSVQLDNLLVSDLQAQSGAARRLGIGMLLLRGLRIARPTETQRTPYQLAAAFLQTAYVRTRDYQGTIRRATFFAQRGRLRLDSVQLGPAPNGSRPHRDATVRFRAARVYLAGLQPTALLRRQLRADSFQLTRPQLLLASAPSAPDQPSATASASDAPSCQLGYVRVLDGWLGATGESAGSVRQIMISGTGVQFGQTSTGTSRLTARTWVARTGRGSCVVGAPFYQLQYSSLLASSQRGGLQLTNLTLVPRLSRAEFARHKRYATPRFVVQVPRVHVWGLDYDALQQGTLQAQEVLAKQPNLSIFRDKRYPVHPWPSRVTPEEVSKLSMRFNVRRVRIAGANVRYTELTPPGRELGTIRFADFQGTFTNLSNDPRRMDAAHPAVLRLTTKLQARCLLRATFWLNLHDPNGAHRMQGTLGPAPLAILNSYLVPSRSVRFDEGNVQHINIQARFNRQGAQGTMLVAYNQLKFTLLTQQKPAKRTNLFTKASSGLLNGILLRDENPRKPGGPLVPGSMQVQRDRRHSVFTLWKQSLITGLLTSFGISTKVAQKVAQ